MELLRKLRSILGRRTAGDGNRTLKNPEQMLASAYYELFRLADQIESHAEKAPYPHVAAQMRRIALEKRSSASALREKMGEIAGEMKPIRAEVKSGKNHWERIAVDLEDQRAFENEILAQAVLFAADAPEISVLLRKMASEQAPHREILLDLLVRADPQADLT